MAGSSTSYTQESRRWQQDGRWSRRPGRTSAGLTCGPRSRSEEADWLRAQGKASCFSTPSGGLRSGASSLPSISRATRLGLTSERALTTGGRSGAPPAAAADT